MKKAWRVILTIVLAAMLLGAVCVGVGLITGADSARIYNLLDERYNVGSYVTAWTAWTQEAINRITEAWQTWRG